MNKNIDTIKFLIELSKAQIETVEREFLNLSENQLKQASRPEAWNIGQCFFHLNTYYQHYIPLIEATLKRNKDELNIPKYSGGWLGKIFIKTVSPENSSKFKAATKHQPLLQLDGRIEVEAFVSYSKRFISCLENSYFKNLNQNRIPVSVAGIIKMKLGDTYQFLVAHNQRHINQALNNLRST